MADKRPLSKHEMMRLIEDVELGRRDESELAEHGIRLGEWTDVSKADLIKQASNHGRSSEQQVVIELYQSEVSYDDRAEIEDAIVEALEEAGVGQWAGAGTFLGEPPSFDISFAVSDPKEAVAIIRSVLRAKGVGKSTEIRVGDETLGVYDE